jgi:SAM-dependent methyltransferase
MNIPNLLNRVHPLYNLVRYGVSSRYKRLARLAQEVAPSSILEIGVWRGDRAQSFIEAALRGGATSVQYFGFDLFEAMPTSLAAAEASRSTRNPTREEVERRLARFDPEQVRSTLIAGNTLETLPQACATLPPIDFAFIDGGHSYETVTSDWECVKKVLRPGGVAVFDDYIEGPGPHPEGFGVNAAVAEIDRRAFEVELLTPVDWWDKPEGTLKNRLVKVTART